MQGQMQKIAQEEYERNWATEGIVTISEILKIIIPLVFTITYSAI
jgi:hypothetical protein